VDFMFICNWIVDNMNYEKSKAVRLQYKVSTGSITSDQYTIQ